MLVSLSENLENRVISEDHIAYSTAILTQAEQSLPMLTDIMGRGELSQPAQAIVNFIKNHNGRVLEVDIKREFQLKEFKNSFEFTHVMDHLRSTGQIEKTQLTGTDGVKRMVVSLPGVTLGEEEK